VCDRDARTTGSTKEHCGRENLTIALHDDIDSQGTSSHARCVYVSRHDGSVPCPSITRSKMAGPSARTNSQWCRATSPATRDAHFFPPRGSCVHSPGSLGDTLSQLLENKLIQNLLAALVGALIGIFASFTVNCTLVEISINLFFGYVSWTGGERSGRRHSGDENAMVVGY
jgi:hypothetical protein